MKANKIDRKCWKLCEYSSRKSITLSSTSESSVNMSDILHGRIYLQREENQINNDTFPAHMKRISKKEESKKEFEYSSPYAFKKHTTRGHPDGDATHLRELKSDQLRIGRPK